MFAFGNRDLMHDSKTKMATLGWWCKCISKTVFHSHTLVFAVAVHLLNMKKHQLTFQWGWLNYQGWRHSHKNQFLIHACVIVLVLPSSYSLHKVLLTTLTTLIPTLVASSTHSYNWVSMHLFSIHAIYIIFWNYQ